MAHLPMKANTKNYEIYVHVTKKLVRCYMYYWIKCYIAALKYPLILGTLEENVDKFRTYFKKVR